MLKSKFEGQMNSWGEKTITSHKHCSEKSHNKTFRNSPDTEAATTTRAKAKRNNRAISLMSYVQQTAQHRTKDCPRSKQAVARFGAWSERTTSTSVSLFASHHHRGCAPCMRLTWSSAEAGGAIQRRSFSVTWPWLFLQLSKSTTTFSNKIFVLLINDLTKDFCKFRNQEQSTKLTFCPLGHCGLAICNAGWFTRRFKS